MNKQEPFVITVSREVGSGGHTVGSILARELNVRFCDKQLLEALQKQFNLNGQAIEKLKGEKKTWISELVKYLAPTPPEESIGLNPKYLQKITDDITPDDIFQAETEILSGFAALGSCVIAGRSGFYVFKDHPNTLHVFITASLPCRIGRIMKKQGLSEEDAADLVKRIDSARENYIKRYAGVSRYDARNYDLVLNSDGHTEEELADIILSYMK